MMDFPEYAAARDALLACVVPVGTERIPLDECLGRILAEDLIAAENIPPFDRSAFDGYAFRAADIAGADHSVPVTLRVTEEIPAGATPTQPVTAGTCAKVLTGAPIPSGADTVINYEVTDFTDDAVTFFAPVRRGSNIVRAGEDVKAGTVLARLGNCIDPGTVGTLAAQGVTHPLVCRVPRVAVLSTGSELVDADKAPGPGMIRNSNAHTLSAALRRIGAEPVYLGIAADTVEGIAELMARGLADCDAVVSTGGVSVGDYDLTPAAMDLIGAEILVRGVRLKPGMACAYGMRDDKLICALSGNPASCLVNFYTVALPALRAMCGVRTPIPEEITLTLAGAFPKSSDVTRILRGTLDLRDGEARLLLPREQGNVVLSSVIGCDALAFIPAGSGPLEAGTRLKGFLI